jgi:hypothetical protein
MYWDLLSKNNNIQMQITDFEDEETIKAFQAINESLKSKNKPLKLGFCKQCGSFHIIFWGCYKKNIRHVVVVQVIEDYPEEAKSNTVAMLQCGDKCRK